MKVGRIGGAIVALAVMGTSHGALATTWLVNCQGLGPGGDTTLSVGVTTDNFGTEPGAISGTGAGAGQPDALGALLGTPDQGTETTTLMADFGVSLSAGDTVQITGICNQLVEARQSSVTITGRTGNIPIAAGPPGSAPIDGDSNQFLVDGAQRVTLNNLLFGSASGEVTLTTTGFFFAEESMLTVIDGAQVLVENSEVANSSTRGIFVRGSSVVALQSSLVTNNGVGNTDETDNGGIFATGGAGVFLGKSSPSGTSAGANPATVSNNTGDGIRVAQGSSLEIRAGTVTGNGQKQIFLATSSAAEIDGNNAFTANGNTSLAAVSAPAGNTNTAISVEDGSNLLLDHQATVTGSTTGAAIGVFGSGTLLLQGSYVSSGTNTIEVTGGSLLALFGGNFICNGALSSGTLNPTCTLPTPYPNADNAIEIDHVGALSDVGFSAGGGFNFTALADTVTGNGVLQLQSTADLGAGLISGNPSLLWTTGAGGINVSQNSSLRMEGGVAITGSVSLAQGSNGFINAAKSGGVANTITSGAIYCPFTNVPASHLSISGSTLSVSPIAPTLATSYTSANPTGSAGPSGANTQGTCLTF